MLVGCDFLSNPTKKTKTCSQNIVETSDITDVLEHLDAVDGSLLVMFDLDNCLYKPVQTFANDYWARKEGEKYIKAYGYFKKGLNAVNPVDYVNIIKRAGKGGLRLRGQTRISPPPIDHPLILDKSFPMIIKFSYNYIIIL